MTSSSMDRSSPMTQTYAYRERVRSTLELAALVVKPKERAGVILKALRGTLYVQRGIRSVQDMHVDLETGSVSDEGREGIEHCKLVLLDPEVCNVQALRASPLCHCSDGVGKGPTALNFCLPEELASGAGGPTVMGDRLRDKLMNLCGTGVHVALTTHFVELSHKNYTMSELLTMLLSHVDTRDNGGTALVALSGFEQVGHIAHVNLSSAHLPYKEMIGQVILDCNPSVTVVVNKMDTISSIYREFAMDVIAQRADALYVEQPNATLRTAEQEARRNELLTATVRQHGCLFRVPYDRVYWNSRLSHEHTRLVERMEEGDALFDVMAGVGPFAIPAAQRGVQVYANDLNPVAAEYMRINAELNHVAPLDMLVYNLDGRDFLNQVLYEHVMGLQGGTSNGTSLSLPQCRGRRHVTMNLPALAVRFLDVFSARMPDSPWRRRPAGATKVDKRVLFHVYCFSSANDVLADAVAQVEESIGYVLPDTHREAVVMVRDVAPTKRMVCVSFTLPDAFWDDQEVGVGDDVPIKCRRTE